MAGNKVSAAHLNSFRNGGDVTLRNVLRSGPRDSTIKQHSADAAAAGIAARLLDAPAISTDDNKQPFDGGAVRVLLPTTEGEAETMSRTLGAFAGGGSLAPGDVFAMSTSTSNFADGSSSLAWRTYHACNANDPAAVFIDKLYGSAGETPTTVIQWSKGTVHKSQ